MALGDRPTGYSFFNGDNGGIPIIGDIANALGGFGQGIGNFFTGDLDWERQLESQRIANSFTEHLQDKANAFSAQQAQLQRDFEERMSNTAYQRAADDMRAVGLNPYAVMAAASTPSGAVASSAMGSGSTGTPSRSSQGIGALLGALIGGAFGLARANVMSSNLLVREAMRSESSLERARIGSSSKTQLYDEDGVLRWTRFDDRTKK